MIKREKTRIIKVVIKMNVKEEEKEEVEDQKINGCIRLRNI